jgi:hypothetical protein
MSLSSKPKVFFDESTIIADRWSLELMANAARRALPSGPGQHIFINLDDFMDSHLYFSVMLACTPNLPLREWKATVTGDDADPQFQRVSKKP